MNRLLTLCALSCAALMAQPARALDDTAAAAAATATAGAAADETSGPAQGHSARSTRQAPARYCMKVEPRTGSRIPARLCRTRAEWEMLGVEISAAK